MRSTLHMPQGLNERLLRAYAYGLQIDFEVWAHANADPVWVARRAASYARAGRWLGDAYNSALIRNALGAVNSLEVDSKAFFMEQLTANAYAVNAGMDDAIDWIHAHKSKAFEYAEEISAEQASVRHSGCLADATGAFLAAYGASRDIAWLHAAERCSNRALLRPAALVDRANQGGNDVFSALPPALTGTEGERMESETLLWWARLLLELDRHRKDLKSGIGLRKEIARTLFDTTLAKAWDPQTGGISKSFSLSREVLEPVKTASVQVEAMIASVRLAAMLKDSSYEKWTERIWHAAEHLLLDSSNGVWRWTGNASGEGRHDYMAMCRMYDILSVCTEPA